MKKFIFLSALCVAFFFSKAQVAVGVEAGGVLSGILWADDYEYSLNVYKTDPKFGFLIGVTADFPVGESFFVNTSLGFRTNGATISNLSLETEHVDSINAAVVKINNLYLDATFNYMFKLGETEIFAGVGGYSAYALSGETTSTLKGIDTTNDLMIGSETTDQILPIDLGLSFKAGVYVTPKIKLSVGYQHGLVNISSQNDLVNPEDSRRYDPVIKNRTGYISVAFMLNRK